MKDVVIVGDDSDSSEDAEDVEEDDTEGIEAAISCKAWVGSTPSSVNS